MSTSPSVPVVPIRGDVYSAECPCRDLMEVVAQKWAALAIGALEGGPRRFSELERRLAGVTPRALTAALRRLEEFRLVARVVPADAPGRVEYSLTPEGVGATAPIAALRTWAESHVAHAVAVDARRAAS